VVLNHLDHCVEGIEYVQMAERTVTTVVNPYIPVEEAPAPSNDLIPVLSAMPVGYSTGSVAAAAAQAGQSAGR